MSDKSPEDKISTIELLLIKARIVRIKHSFRLNQTVLYN